MKNNTIPRVFIVTLVLLTITACATTGNAAATQSKPAGSEIVIINEARGDYNFLTERKPYLSSYVSIENNQNETIYPQKGDSAVAPIGGNKSVTVKVANGSYTVKLRSKPDGKVSKAGTYEITSLTNSKITLSYDGEKTLLVSIEHLDADKTFDRFAELVDAAWIPIDQALSKNLKPNASVAVFPISSDNADQGELILENITGHLVNAKYTVIEKRLIDELLAEYDFQRSGLVDEASLTIGKLLGADAVIFGVAGRYNLVLLAVDMAKRTVLAQAKQETSEHVSN
ncbi:hypothetical protein AGMMS49928_16950 [Spirochaetia bacterium]|nr:hypothetical protein AGMMS49928_16950 [Spirochaetia bacterium]